MSPQQMKNLIPTREIPGEAEKLCPPVGRVHRGSAWRWMAAGVGGHRLQSVRIAGRRYTRKKWLEAFIEKAMIQDVRGN